MKLLILEACRGKDRQTVAINTEAVESLVQEPDGTISLATKHTTFSFPKQDFRAFVDKLERTARGAV